MIPDITAAIVLVCFLFILLAMGLEIAWSIGIAAMVGLFLIGQPINQFAWTSWQCLNSFVLTAAPLFIFMGALLGNSGISERLFSGIEKLIGRIFPGGVAISVIAGSGIFGAMCGSSLASTATFGKIGYPAMEKRGYDPKIALGSIAMGAILSPLIPPSILLILYGAWTRVSIVDLFAGAVIPGIMLAASYIITIIIWVKINPAIAPKTAKVSLNEKLLAIKDVFPFVALILFILGSIFMGIMTPTEAGALGAVLSVLFIMVYKLFTFKVFSDSLLETVKVSTMSFFIMAMAMVLVHVFNILGLTSRLTEIFIHLPIGRYGVLVCILAMYLVLGMFFDSWSMMFLTVSFVLPVIVHYDFNPVWWGVIYVMAGEQSAVTPPFGLSLFVLRTVVPQHTMGTVCLGSLPFLIALYINIVLLTAFPQIVLWLPSLLR